MCLRTVTNVNLKRTKVDGIIRFVGVGYKGMYDGKVNGKIGKWIKARPICGVNTLELTTLGYNRYYPGFHIWTDMKDAITYCRAGYKKLYKVSYYEVIAYGGNSNGVRITKLGKPCVIANWMKYECELDIKTGVEK